MNNYQIYKEKMREKAIEWQHDFGNHNYSYQELNKYQNYFRKKAKIYGLIKEFKENGII